MPTRRRISARFCFATGSPATVTDPAPPVEDAVEVQDEGGLAGAVGAEQRDPLAAPDGQVDAEQGLMAVGVGEGEPGHLEGRDVRGHGEDTEVTGPAGSMSQDPAQQTDRERRHREGDGVRPLGPGRRHLVDHRHGARRSPG